MHSCLDMAQPQLNTCQILSKYSFILQKNVTMYRVAACIKMNQLVLIQDTLNSFFMSLTGNKQCSQYLNRRNIICKHVFHPIHARFRTTCSRCKCIFLLFGWLQPYTWLVTRAARTIHLKPATPFVSNCNRYVTIHRTEVEKGTLWKPSGYIILVPRLALNPQGNKNKTVYLITM